MFDATSHLRAPTENLADFAAGFFPSTYRPDMKPNCRNWLDMLLSTAAIQEETRSNVVSETDVQDIKATLQGDGDAYARIVDRYQQRIGQSMWRFTRDRRVYEELVHEVFVEAYFSLKNYGGKAPLEHWLARIATRVGYRHWSEKEKQKKRTPLDVQDWDVPEEERSEAVLAAEEVHFTLQQLPPRDRLVLTFMYLDECSVEEIAQRTGWSKTMVKVQAHRARGKLKKLLENRQ